MIYIIEQLHVSVLKVYTLSVSARALALRTRVLRAQGGSGISLVPIWPGNEARVET